WWCRGVLRPAVSSALRDATRRPAVATARRPAAHFPCHPSPTLGSCPGGDRRVHRGLLQQPAPALVAGGRLPGGVRTEKPLTPCPLFVGNSKDLEDTDERRANESRAEHS